MAFEFIEGKDIESKLTEGTTVVNFFAQWCGPCKMMAPVFEQLGTREDLHVFKIDIDVEGNREVAKSLNLEGLPSTLIYKNKKLLFTYTGYMDRETLEKKIAEL